MNKISDELPLDLRADLIYALIGNDLIKGISPELLIDEGGNRIFSGSSVFLSPERKVFALPSWVSQKVLSSEFTAKLRERFGVSRIRDLSLKLGGFKVQEYNMNSLVSSITAEINRRAKDNPDDELSLRKQMTQAIWNLYLGKEYSGGNKLAPSKCSLARGAKDLEPIIGFPAIDQG